LPNATINAPETRRHHLDRRANELAAQGAGHPDDLLSTPELAAWLGCSRLWVELGRVEGYGPAFVQVGPKMIRYRRSDVLAWLASRSRTATSKR
jgi:predicted DNA-binding transcriptional regulator AlpA